MAFKIIVSKEAQKRYDEIIVFLLTGWSENVAKGFAEKFDFVAHQLSLSPYTGVRTETNNDVRCILITPHNRLYYTVRNETIFLITIWDTRQDPEENLFQ